MKRIMGLVILTAVIAIGCAGVSPQTPPTTPGVPIWEGPTVQVQDDGITMTVRISSAVHRPDQPVVVTVTAKNTSTQPINWVGNSGCDNGLYVRVITDQGDIWFQPKRDGPSMACTDVMTQGTLDPGAEIEDQFTWDQLIDGVRLAPGDHRIVASFRRGDHYDQVKPAEVQAKVRLEGS